MPRQQAGGRTRVGAQDRQIWGNELLQTRERRYLIVCKRLEPGDGPRRLNPEGRVALAHQLREAELVRAGVNEIYRTLALALLQLKCSRSSPGYRLLGGNDLCKLFHRRIMEQLRHAETDAEGEVNPVNHLGQHQRMPAQFKKIVVDAHLLHLEKFTPDAGQ